MLRGLFRQKLENEEVIPSPSVNKQIMSRLGRREFLRFNPSRFNIWYTGAIVVAGTAIALILASGYRKTEKAAPVNSTEKRESAIIQNPVNSNSQVSAPEENVLSEGMSEMKTPGKLSDVNNNIQINNSLQGKSIPAPCGVKGSLPEEGLFRQTGSPGTSSRVERR